MANYQSLKDFAIAKNIITNETQITEEKLIELVNKNYSLITAQHYVLLIPKEDIEKYSNDNMTTLFVPMDKLTQYDRYIIGKED